MLALRTRLALPILIQILGGRVFRLNTAPPGKFSFDDATREYYGYIWYIPVERRSVR